jgi:heat-inducible transcriptional repressor
VGSRTLSKYSGLDLSPATIRNVMSDLEDMGYIASRTPRAGRIPTPRGYRFFVDTLLSVQPLEPGQISELKGELRPADPRLLVNQASQLLSAAHPLRRHRRRAAPPVAAHPPDRIPEPVGQTHPAHHRDRHRRGAEPHPADRTQLFAVGAGQCGQLPEPALRRLRFRRDPRPAAGGTEAVARRSDHADVGRAAGRNEAFSDDKGQYVITGERNLLEVDDLASNMSRLRELFSLFDQRTQLASLLDLSQRADGVQIFIGGESGLAPLDECSVVTAPYEVQGQVVGTVGVIGPTRMAYERVIPIVDVTAKLLSSALSQT